MISHTHKRTCCPPIEPTNEESCGAFRPHLPCSVVIVKSVYVISNLLKLFNFLLQSAAALKRQIAVEDMQLSACTKHCRFGTPTWTMTNLRYYEANIWGGTKGRSFHTIERLLAWGFSLIRLPRNTTVLVFPRSYAFFKNSFCHYKKNKRSFRLVVQWTEEGSSCLGNESGKAKPNPVPSQAHQVSIFAG